MIRSPRCFWGGRSADLNGGVPHPRWCGEARRLDVPDSEGRLLDRRNSYWHECQNGVCRGHAGGEIAVGGFREHPLGCELEIGASRRRAAMRARGKVHCYVRIRRAAGPWRKFEGAMAVVTNAEHSLGEKTAAENDSGNSAGNQVLEASRHRDFPPANIPLRYSQATCVSHGRPRPSRGASESASRRGCGPPPPIGSVPATDDGASTNGRASTKVRCNAHRLTRRCPPTTQAYRAKSVTARVLIETGNPFRAHYRTRSLPCFCWCAPSSLVPKCVAGRCIFWRSLLPPCQPPWGRCRSAHCASVPMAIAQSSRSRWVAVGTLRRNIRVRWSLVLPISAPTSRSGRKALSQLAALRSIARSWRTPSPSHRSPGSRWLQTTKRSGRTALRRSSNRRVRNAPRSYSVDSPARLTSARP